MNLSSCFECVFVLCMYVFDCAYQFISIHVRIYCTTFLCPRLSLLRYVYISSHLCINTSVSSHLCINTSVYISIYRSIYLEIHTSTNSPIYLSIYLSTYISIYLFIYLPIYLSPYQFYVSFKSCVLKQCQTIFHNCCYRPTIFCCRIFSLKNSRTKQFLFSFIYSHD